MLRLPLAAVLAIAPHLPAQDSPTEREAWPDGSRRLECEHRDDGSRGSLRHGAFTSWHENGQRAEEGRYADGHRVGTWSSWHDNGQKAGEGAYKQGLRNTKWRYWDREGKVDRERSGTYRAQLEPWPSGARRIAGELRGKHRHGDWTFTSEAGVVLARGAYARHRRTGPWKFYWPGDGRLRYEGEYLRGARTGRWTFTYPGGAIDPTLLSGLYEKDERAGDLPGIRFDLPTDLPAPRPHPGLDEEAQDGMRDSVARFLDQPARRAALRGELLERGREALPAAVDALLRLDPSRTEEVERGFVLTYELLAPMHRGHAYAWAPGTEEEAQQANRRAAARWWALWETTRDLPGYLASLEEVEPSPQDSPVLLALPFDPFAAPEPPPAVVPTSSASRIASDPKLRRKALRKYGGAGTEELLAGAIDWLVRHQAQDGHWSSSNFGMQCAAAGATKFCPGAGKAGHDVGVTGLALLALMGDGSGPVGGPHQDAVARGLDWLLQQQSDKTGLFGVKRNHEHVYGHVLATLAVCRALRSGGSPQLVPVLEAARDEILRRQLKGGGWRYDVHEDRSDSSVTPWMVYALVELEACGLSVPEEAVPKALKWFGTVTTAETGAVGYYASGSQSARVHGENDHFGQVCETLTAASLYAHIAAGRTRKQAPWMEAQVELVLSKPPTWGQHSADYYGWYHGTYALFHWGKRPWKSWNAALVAALEAAAAKAPGEHHHGSFSTDSPWSSRGGRVYSTAICALILEVYLSGRPLID